MTELSAEQLREMAGRLLLDVRHKQTLIDKLTHENALLKRLKFATQSERYSAEQRSLLDETLDADLQASATRSSNSPLPRPRHARSGNPSASRCPRTCRAARFATSPRAPAAAVAPK